MGIWICKRHRTRQMTNFQIGNLLLGLGACILLVMCLFFYNNTLKRKNAEIQSLHEQIVIEAQDDLTGINVAASVKEKPMEN